MLPVAKGTTRSTLQQVVNLQALSSLQWLSRCRVSCYETPGGGRLVAGVWMALGFIPAEERLRSHHCRAASGTQPGVSPPCWKTNTTTATIPPVFLDVIQKHSHLVSQNIFRVEV